MVKQISAFPARLSCISPGRLRIAAVALLVRLMFTIFADSQNIWWYIIAGLAICGISYGILASLRQTNLERIVVYSSIAQMSYVLLGVVAANEGAATAMTYYLFTYLFMVTGVFGVLDRGARQRMLPREF